MTAVVTTNQTRHVDTYIPDCEPFKETVRCNDNYWNYPENGNYNSPCFATGDQPYCSRIDPSLCTTINGQSGDINWVLPHLTSSPLDDQRNPQVKCTYPVETFNTYSLLQQFQNTYRNYGNYQEALGNILSNFCFLPNTTSGTTCPVDYRTGKPMAQCSNYVATETAALCGTWGSNHQTQATSNMNAYCSKYTNSDDCGCINRSLNPYYKILESGAPGFDACWWIPCKTYNQFLVPYEPTGFRNPTCPTMLCQQVINNYVNEGGSIDVTVAQQNISCNLQSGNGSEAAKTNIWWIITIIVIFIIIAIVALIFYFITRPRQR